jgi:hypothetical protein
MASSLHFEGDGNGAAIGLREMADIAISNYRHAP